MSEILKKCRKCKEPKPISEFIPMRIGKFGVWTTCLSCTNLWGAKTELKRTPIKKIGKKKIQRIKDNGSEFKVFVEIWKEREHICDNCWGYIQFFDPSCFAHKLAKWANPELRYDKENIALVHGIWEKIDETWKTYQCHKEYDLKFNQLKKWLIQESK